MLFLSEYHSRYCPFLFRTRGEVNTISPSLLIERWAAWFNRSLQMLQVLLGKVFQTGHYCWVVKMLPTVQGAHSHLLCQGDQYLPMVLGRCSLLAPAMPPEDINSACGSLGALSCPPPGGIICLSIYHTAASVLTDLLCDYWLIFILKSKMTPPTAFSWSRWGSIHKVPSTGRAGAVATSNTDVETGSWERYSSSCIYMYVYMYVYFMAWAFLPLEEKLFSLQWPELPLLLRKVAVPATVGGKQWPFF